MSCKCRYGATVRKRLTVLGSISYSLIVLRKLEDSHRLLNEDEDCDDPDFDPSVRHQWKQLDKITESFAKAKACGRTHTHSRAHS